MGIRINILQSIWKIAGICILFSSTPLFPGKGALVSREISALGHHEAVLGIDGQEPRGHEASSVLLLVAYDDFSSNTQYFRCGVDSEHVVSC